MGYRFSLFVIVVAFIALLPAGAQERYTLTLEGAIEMAEAQSPAARIARSSFESTRWNYKSFQASYLPSFSLNASAPGFIRSLNSVEQDDGSIRYVQQRRTFSSMGLQMNQAIPFTGGTFSVSSNLSYIDQTGGFGFSQWQSAPISLSLNQPLFQFNSMKWERRLEPMQFRVAERSYVETLAGNASEMADLFFAVYDAQKSIDIATFNVAVNDTIFTLSQGRFDIGRIAENDLLQSELQLINAQTELSNAQISYQRALQDLKIALNLPYDAEIEVVPPLDIPDVEIDPDAAVQYARRNRPAFLSLELDALRAEQEVERARRDQFSVDMRASYGLNQSSEAFDDVYIAPLDRQQFSVGFQVPIFQWGQSRSRLKAALADQDRAKEEKALQEAELDQIVYFQVLQLQLLQRQVEIAAQADTIATRRFEVARNRYLVGNIDITDLFNAQREKDAANRSFIQTLRQFWSSLYDVRRLTLYDFVEGRPLMF